MDEQQQFVEQALAAADAGDAGYWPTVAGYLADEVRRLRRIETAARAFDRDMPVGVKIHPNSPAVLGLRAVLNGDA